MLRYIYNIIIIIRDKTIKIENRERQDKEPRGVTENIVNRYSNPLEVNNNAG